MKTSEKIKLFNKLYEENYHRLMRMLHSITYNQIEEREDIAQETFTRVWKAIDEDKYDPELCDPSTWIYAIAKRASMDLQENKTRQIPEFYLDIVDAERYNPPEESDAEDESVFYMDPDDIPDNAMVDYDTPEAVYMREQMQSEMERRVNELPEHYREPVVLYFYRGLTYKQIADTLGTTEGTINVYINRAKSILREKHESEGSESYPIAINAGRA